MQFSAMRLNTCQISIRLKYYQGTSMLPEKPLKVSRHLLRSPFPHQKDLRPSHASHLSWKHMHVEGHQSDVAAQSIY